LEGLQDDRNEKSHENHHHQDYIGEEVGQGKDLASASD
jgi:hypothetical protein